ncbi:hypothetical protein CYY_007629 [Polysphondylium violaceum]|uniref:Uncharacterized protein n=1 Tax=Polysphondylium violaceum TaxID=133409 RepID=A0A8J4UXX0_9MYCE|nr:hypothetical protein CYY_007629 [Polysphondylium violaceum]
MIANNNNINDNDNDIQITISDASEQESILTNQLGWEYKQYIKVIRYGGRPDTVFPDELSYGQQVESFKQSTYSDMQFYIDMDIQNGQVVIGITPDEIIAHNIDTVYCRMFAYVEVPATIKISFNRPKTIGKYELLSLYTRAFQYVWSFFPTGNKYQVFGHALEDLRYNTYSIIKIFDHAIAIQFNVDS